VNRRPAPGWPWLACASLAAAALWCAWPWLRPRLAPASGRPWLVVLDGYHRLDAALQLQRRPQHHRWPILLITCPATGQPTPAQRAQAVAPVVVVMEQPPNGGDTAGQAAALAQWLQRQPAPLRPAHGLLLSDQSHFPRAAWTLQLAAGSFGTSVHSWPVDAPGAANVALDPWAWPQLWPAVRDVLRLQLWRLSGSTGAVLNAPKQESKARACFTAHS
jgi:uncharacterized SAM-binding protein YcdF (DUF218 family)